MKQLNHPQEKKDPEYAAFIENLVSSFDYVQPEPDDGRCSECGGSDGSHSLTCGGAQGIFYPRL